MKQRVLIIGVVVGALAVGVGACGGTDVGQQPAPGEATGAAPSAGAAIPGGGLSIQEAIDSPLAGPLMVAGFVVAAPDGSVRLCAVLAESFPPQCGGASLALKGLDLETVEGLVRDAADPGRAWTQTQVSLLGEIEDGVMTVSQTSI